MAYTVISEKGQITLPSALRKQANIHPGTRIEIELRDNEIVLHPIRPLHELYGVSQRYAVGKGHDYDQIREMAMQEMAAEIAHEERE